LKFKKPSIILVRPQLPENIGMVARVMKNFNLKDLILINPREQWPNKESVNASKNASNLIRKAKVYNSLNEALLNFEFVVATTNRKRFLEKNKIESFNLLNRYLKINSNSAILFGPENSGLSNKDLRLVDCLFTIETSSRNDSLNLSHAVAIVAYKINEYYLKKNRISNYTKNNSNLSKKKDLNNFLNFLIDNLDKKNFFYPLGKKERMIDNICSIFLKASLTKKEVNTLWGMLKKLGN